MNKSGQEPFDLPDSPPIRVGMVNLGCPKNQVDSEVMLGLLRKHGFEPAGDPSDAEVVVINTCGFIDAAKQESVNALLEFGRLKKKGTCRVLIAAGCLAQRYPEDLIKEIPELDAVVGTGDFPKIAEISRRLIREKAPVEKRNARKKSFGSLPVIAMTDSPTFLYSETTPRRRLSPGHWAYVKVSEGCNYRCSFCAIPSFRGDLASRPAEDIVSEVTRLAAEGVREINLIAQSLTSYGWDRREKEALVPLLRRLADISGPRWIRLFYTYPTDIHDPLLEFMAGEPKICRYVDLPLQHINDRILKKMNRKGDRRLVEDLLVRIRRTVPGVTLRSTFIVGFPGETDAEFEELAGFIETTRFDRLGVFTYSREDGTSAWDLGDPVPAEVKAERQRRLLDIQAGIVAEKHEALIGSVHEVMVDGPSEEEDWSLEGRMEGQAPEIDGVVYLEGEGLGGIKPGEFVKIEVTDAIGNDLAGRVRP